MRNNKIIKLTIILLIMFVTLISFNIKVYASFDPVGNPDDFNPSTTRTDEVKLKQKAGIILGYINVIGVVISVITLAVIGIKYMLGSVEEKAEYKNTIMMYLIGAFLIFGVTTVPNLIYKAVLFIEK